MKPLVSVLMPSFNQAGFIERSVRSVLEQDYTHLELLVADGGSTDGTVDLLANLQAQDDRLRWFSGPDSGPANAINRALPQLRGTVFGWLNSDDVYTPGALQRAVQALEDRPDWLMVYGQGQHTDAHDVPLSAYPTKQPADFGEGLAWRTGLEAFRNGCFICQPTVVFKRALWLLLGNLDESLQTAFDLDYWLRAFARMPERVGFVDAVQACSRLHGDCITLRQRRLVALEGMQLLHKHTGWAPKEWALTYLHEQLADCHGLGGVELRQDMNGMLAQIQPWLRPADWEELVLQTRELLK